MNPKKSIPEGLKYAKSHEWGRLDNDGILTIGITEHAQDLLGDLVYIELPEIGQQLDAGEECAVLESVKAAADVYAPAGGEVVEINQEVVDTPELLNQSPYDKGWLFKIRLSNAGADLDKLMSAADYGEMLAQEEGE